MITLTDSAAKKMEQLMANEGASDLALRVAVKRGGCSGFSYVLEFDSPREGDNILEQDNVKFFMDRKSAIYLKGIQLDYRAGLKGKGFVFQNPNATSTCGCGESFSV